MGYDIYTYVAMVQLEPTQQQTLINDLQAFSVQCDWPVNDSSKWSKLAADSLKLSQKFPNVIFAFLYAGQDHDDNRYFLVHHGVNTPKIEIELSDEINDLYNQIENINSTHITCSHLPISTPQPQLNCRKWTPPECLSCQKLEDEIDEQVDDLTEEIWLRRLQHLETTIKNLNMVNISSYLMKKIDSNDEDL